MKYTNILETVGSMPHLNINNPFSTKYEVWLKLEKANPGGNIKDCIALAMVEEAEKKGILTKNSVIIEPTSGNTGIGLALVAAVKKYKPPVRSASPSKTIRSLQRRPSADPKRMWQLGARKQRRLSAADSTAQPDSCSP